MIDGQLGKETMVRFECLLPAPIECVWEFLAKSEHLAGWLGGDSIEPRPGSTVDIADGPIRRVVTTATRAFCRTAVAFLLFCLGCASRPQDSSSDQDKARVPLAAVSNSQGNLATKRAHETAAQFEDRTEEAGIAFSYRNGQESGHFSILESLGGGVALFDYDSDGDLDLFVPGGGQFAPANQIHGYDRVFSATMVAGPLQRSRESPALEWRGITVTESRRPTTTRMVFVTCW